MSSVFSASPLTFARLHSVRCGLDRANLNNKRHGCNKFTQILGNVNPLPSIGCVNRRKYNGRYWGTALWTHFPSKDREISNGRKVFGAAGAGAIWRGLVVRLSQFTVQSSGFERWECGGWGGGQVWNPEEGEHLPLEAATKQQLM
jgi:hypothetical protein